ncbi:MAG: hypothetical protein AAFX79_07220 [Planctomycetota bacterium]
MSRDRASLDVWDDDDASPGGSHAPNPLLLVHRALRGRYVLAGVIGLCLAVPGALAGYRAKAPVYTSTGVVTIDPNQPVIVSASEENSTIPAFDSFLNSQSRIIQSPRILQNAADELATQGKWPAGLEGRGALQSALQVSVPRGSRDIVVSITDTNPTRARNAAQAVLATYMDIVVSQLNSETERTNAFREELMAGYEAQRNRLLGEAQQAIAERGIADLDQRRRFVQEQIENLDREIQALQTQLPPEAAEGDAAVDDGQIDDPSEDVEAGSGVTPGDQPVDSSIPQLTVEDYARIDSQLAELLAERRSSERQIELLSSRVGPSHRDLLMARDEFDAVQDRIDARIEMLGEIGIDLATGVAGGGATLDPTERLAALQQQRNAQRESARDLGTLAINVEKLRQQAAFADQQYNSAKALAETARIRQDARIPGRIFISQDAAQPLGPSRDRRKPLAALGAAGGIGLSFAAFAGLGFLRPRYRYVADLEDESRAPPVLGLVPMVEDGRIDHDEAAQAGVHQIRSLLESDDAGPRGRVVVITSATAAEGKSTLAAAIASSMSRAGRRTLLLDADLVGRGLTSRLDASGLAGLSDRVSNPNANGEVHEVQGRENLFLMPAGCVDGFCAERLSGKIMQGIIESLRGQFETIVVDTGPILGSLEANAVVPTCDQVVLVISRGQDIRLVKAAIDRLRRFGAKHVGLVFNRAARVDIERSTSVASLSIRSRMASRQAQAPSLSAGA